MKFVIIEPIWKGRQVGLDEAKMDAQNQVVILWRMKDGELLFPYTYLISKEDALKYPIQIIKRHKLRIIPIADMRPS